MAVFDILRCMNQNLFMQELRLGMTHFIHIYSSYYRLSKEEEKEKKKKLKFEQKKKEKIHCKYCTVNI